MADKIKLEKNTVMETLVMPLYGRAVCSEKYPDIFPDKSAEEVIKKVDYDFSRLNYAEFTVMVWALRRQFLCDRAKKYLKDHPGATIVNLGAGADESFSLIDNGKCRFINLDLPDVIAAREQLIPLREREKNVAIDAFDTEWFSQVETKPEDGLFVISGGVLMYFTADKIKPLFTALAEQFPGGGICFDAENQRGVDKSNKVIRKSGNTDSLVVLAVDDAEAMFSPWSDKFKTITTFNAIPEKIRKDKRIPFVTKNILKMGAAMGFFKFVEIVFK